ncbi:MAG: NADPH-dependent F420 reductase [Chloroflexota bacterium]|nr:NADPH-dependent F420 reductase [Chloroflexota bacterium]
MRIAVIGTGNLGKALTRSLTKAGHEVTLTSAHPEHAAQVAEELGVNAVDSTADAVRQNEAVVLAVPFASAGKEVAAEIASVADGKIVIDATNPIGPDMKLVTDGSSAAESFQHWLPRAKVVKAFNTMFASRQAEPAEGEVELDGFVAGDDADAKRQVMDVIGSLGLRPIDAGELAFARILEGMALLNIKLQIANGWNWRTAWKLVD